MKILIEDLKPGMTLSEEVRGANGRLLLPDGVTLTEQHLRIFNIWGVSEAEIESGSDALDEESGLSESIKEEAASHAEKLFSAADLSVEPMQAVFRASRKYYEKSLSDSGKLTPLPEVKGPAPDIPEEPYYQCVSDFMCSDICLSSFSEVYYKVVDVLNSPKSTSNTIAEIISKDPGLSSRLLSLVNSPVYGFKNRVDSLSRAVSMVGTSCLSQLALSVSVMDAFKGLDSYFLSMSDFWRHSLACAVFCRILSTDVPGTNPDTCFVVGMLHDAGRLAMLQNDAEKVELIFQIAMHQGICLKDAERMVFGFDHCQLAGRLFKEWHFPESISMAIVGHHGELGGEMAVESAICSLADVLAVALQLGFNGVGFVHAPYPGAWDSLTLPEGTIATAIMKSQRQLRDIMAIFGV